MYVLEGISCPVEEIRQIFMKCLRCKGTMLVERQYTRVSRRFNAKCINCGFWFDLADVLRFFKRVLESGAQGQKIRETL